MARNAFLDCFLSIGPDEIYRRDVSEYKRSVRNLFSGLIDSFDHLPVVCHLFREPPPTVEVDAEDWLKR